MAKMIKCKRCNRVRPYYAKGLCQSCYLEEYRREKISERQLAPLLLQFSPETQLKLLGLKPINEI